MPTLTINKRHQIALIARQELARRNYIDYVEYVHNGLFAPNRHSEFICSILQQAIDKKKRMRAGEIPVENQYFIIDEPPRHGKSMTITETYPSYYLGNFPNDRVIEGSYGTNFAEKFGKKNRQKIEHYGQELFGIELSRSTQSSTDWNLNNDVGGMISRGMLAGVTGEGADLMIIDDPVKTREEADSEVYREKLWGEWVDSFSTRLHPGAIVIVIMTRWHEDDLVGRLQNPEVAEVLPWKVINLPLEAEENDVLGRNVGEPLWPERYGYDFIEQRKHYPSSFNALYQGRPTSQQGNILKRDWWQYYDAIPPNIQRWILSVDANFKDEKSSTSKKANPDTDFVSIQVWGKVNANSYLIDRVHARLNFPATLKAIENIIAKYQKIGAKYIEDKANGPAIISMLRNKIGGFIPVPAKEGKVARVNAVSPYIEAGNVYLPRSEWINEVVEECAAFPKGTHDDDVDAMSQALNRIYYFNADVPEERDPDNPTPQELHEKAVRKITGGNPNINAFKW